MASVTFTPKPPLVGATVEPEFKVLSAEFGDGYSQRAPDGLNNVRETHAFTWEVPAADADYIVGFLKDRRGAEAFDYACPDGVTRQFVCPKGATRERLRPTLHKVTAQFVEVFDL
ncbi:hypothetical protein [Azospirillum argentinense]|uniref:phage tail protein n=1 Tax=Azospirillum argentinense TaxID=2970906 RepID=UPI0032DEE1EF